MAAALREGALALVRGTVFASRTDDLLTMGMERIDLREFLGDSLERLGMSIPDRVVFTCRFTDTPDVQADPARLRAALAELITNACKGSGEIQLRTGTVAGRSGPHAFVEVHRPDTGGRIILPVPAFRRGAIQLAALEPARSNR